MSGFLPVSRKEMKERGMEQLDFVYVIGDAYVDHPSFGHAIISRLLEAHGYTVGIISQPDWKNDESIAVFGEPRLGFLVSAGNMDSMVNHYSVSKKRRQTDAYTPGGVMGKRPDRAVTVYSNLIRRTYKKTPIIIGGIEASLRRLAHYDYWDNSLKRSVLLDSGADILSYGMGERSILAIAEALDAGIAVSDIGFIPGTVYKTQHLENVYDYEMLPSFEKMKEDKANYARSFYTQYCNTDSITGKRLVEPYPNKIYVVQNPPSALLFHEDWSAHKQTPLSVDPARYNTCRWKSWTASDKNPAPAPAYTPDLSNTLPASLPLSWYSPDEKTSDKAPETGSSHIFH